MPKSDENASFKDIKLASWINAENAFKVVISLAFFWIIFEFVISNSVCIIFLNYFFKFESKHLTSKLVFITNIKILFTVINML